jgi:hypothetical protein
LPCITLNTNAIQIKIIHILRKKIQKYVQREPSLLTTLDAQTFAHLSMDAPVGSVVSVK